MKFIQDWIDHKVASINSFKKEAVRWYKEWKEEYNENPSRWETSSYKVRYQHYYTAYKKIENSLITKENYLNKLTKLLDTYMPDKYDIQDNGIYLHFEREELEDSYGNKHIIRDLYFRITPSYHDNKTFDIKAIRKTATPLELFCNYNHSHIDNSPGMWTKNICFGSDYNLHPTENVFLNFELLLMYLPSFVQRESSYTNPYKYISKLGVGKEEISGHNNYNFVINTPITFNIGYNVRKWGLSNIIVIDDEELDKWLARTYGREAMCYMIGDKYYKQALLTSNVKFHHNDTFRFKGEEVENKIIPLDTELKEPEMVLNPYFKQKFIKYAEEFLTELASTTQVAATNADDGQDVEAYYQPDLVGQD